MSFVDEYNRPRFTVSKRSPDILDVPEAGRRLLKSIAGGESPSYNTIYGGGTFDDYSDHPRRAVPITSGPNAGKTSSGAGLYQFLGSTWDEVAQEAGLKDFSPKSQDAGAWHLAQKTYKAKTGRDLLTDLEQGKDVNEIGKALSGVWTSLPGGIEPNQATASFASRFSGEGGTPTTGDVPPRAGPGLDFVGSAQAAEAPRKTSGLFDDVLGGPAEPKKATSGLFDDVLEAPAAPTQRQIPTTGFQPSGNIDELAKQLRRSADEKLAGFAGGGAQGEFGTFGSQFANTLLLNAPRNAMALYISQQQGIPFTQAYDMLKDIDQAGDRLNPKSSWAGFGAGVVGGMALPGLSAAKAAGAAERAVTAGLTAGGYGALSEAFDTKDFNKAIQAGTIGFLAGTALAPVAEKVVGAIQRRYGKKAADIAFLKSDGSLTDEAAAAAREAGYDPAQLNQAVRDAIAAKFEQKGATPAAAREVQADEFKIPLTQGQATKDLGQIRREDMMARGAMGDPAQEIAAAGREAQFGAIREAGGDINTQLARGQTVARDPAEAAAIANADLAEKAAQARKNVADHESAAQLEAELTRSSIARRQEELSGHFAGGRPPLERVQDAGAEIGQTVRDAAAASKANYKQQWEGALSKEGEFSDLAFRDIGERVRRDVTAKTGLEVTPELTPNANGALIALDRKLGELRFQNRAIPRDAEGRTAGFIRHPGEPVRMGGEVQGPAELAGVTLRGMDTARKIMGQYFARALASGDKTDIRATRQIMDSFIKDVETSVSTGLFKGDPEAWPALKEAIAAFRQHRQNFTKQYDDGGVGNAMKQIIDQKATPEEISNMFIGYGRAGDKGLPVRLFDHMERVFGKDNEVVGATRQAMWEKISQVKNAAGEVDPMKSASAILDFSGSTLAKRMYGPEELAAMQRHANGVRNLEATIKGGGWAQKAEELRTGYQAQFGGDNIGGAPATVFRKIVDGTATPQETASVVFNTLSGNPGNAERMIKAVENIAGKDSDTMAAIRQGVWQRLTTNAEGKDQPGAQKLSQGISDFLNGDGRGIAEKLYTTEELALMRRYAAAVKMTVIPPLARTNSDTAPAAASLLRHYGGAINGLIGGAINKVTLGMGGAVYDTLVKSNLKRRADAREAGKATQAFTGGAPAYVPPPPPVTDKTAVTTGLGVGRAIEPMFSEDRR